MGGGFCFVETPSEKFWSFFLSYAISGPAAPYYKQKPPNRGTLMRPERGPAPTAPLSPAAPQRRIPMNTKNFPLEAYGAAVSREELVQAALDEITKNYREASLSNVARSYGVSLAYVSECVRAQTGRTYKELLQKHRMETAACAAATGTSSRSSPMSATRTPAISTACSTSGTARAPVSTARAARPAPAHRPDL